MNTRRDFLKQAAALGAAGSLPASIRRALAIDPAPGSTWQDAEHVVILMQENRSFDHCFGTLRGVRGFSDPRAVTLPDGLPVWLQTNTAGEVHAPFPLELMESKSTWMQSLPHSWADQIQARRDGHHDQWLVAKASHNKDYAHLPLTLGYYTRKDLPFHYALADAFTICDQAFCSSLTGTTPNRLFLWTGTIRPEAAADQPACLRNSDVDYSREAAWKTFPERLQENGISWRIYQNELSLPTGLSREQDPWLANFTDNTLELFSQYQVRFSPSHRKWLEEEETRLQTLLAAPGPGAGSPEADENRKQLQHIQAERKRWSEAAFDALSETSRDLHARAFTTNSGDPLYRKLVAVPVPGPDENRKTMQVPAGDILHQFREDVRTQKLPAVSWLVAPQHFSDHPESPWYGAWYVSEVFDILTKNPDIWRKTIFILCYDENDGWFDHVPPFTAPDPDQPGSGGVWADLDARAEYQTAEEEQAWRVRNPRGATAAGPAGLGYRVPLLIASPWSRGGAVCSQVFDHTSTIQFLEKWLSGKTGKPVRETNISPWRRAICGDLTSAFVPWQGEAVPLPDTVHRQEWFDALQLAQHKPVPAPVKIPDAVVAAWKSGKPDPSILPRQELGQRISRALPYDLSIDAAANPGRYGMVLTFRSSTRRFGERTAGAGFHVYAPPLPGAAPGAGGPSIPPRSFTIAPGSGASGEWRDSDFPGNRIHLHAHGPNGFFRSWKQLVAEPFIKIDLQPGSAAGDRHVITLTIKCIQGPPQMTVIIEDRVYAQRVVKIQLTADGPDKAGSRGGFRLDRSGSYGWYDWRITLEGFPDWEQRLAGRVEDGLPGWSDPVLGWEAV